ILPWDLDNTFTRLPHNVDPLTWHKEERFHGRPWYDLAVADPEYHAAYVDALERVLEVAYDVPHVWELMDEWTAQIKDAVFLDQNKPFSNRLYLEQVHVMRQYVANRARFLERWVRCNKMQAADGQGCMGQD